MSRAQETIAAIVRRYREWVTAGLPADWPLAQQFANLYRFQQSPDNDRAMESAALSILVLFKHAKQGRASMKSVSLVLGALVSKGN